MNKKKEVLTTAVKAVLLIVLTLTFARGTLAMINMTLHKSRSQGIDLNLREISRVELRKHDGSDESIPIYLAYEGRVYDVSEGREYYKKGGVYHYLAGKDSTVELNIAGGSIIKRKYPVIGRLE